MPMTETQPTPRPWPCQLRQISLRLLRLLVIGYVTITLMLVVMESRLVYPGAYLPRSPALPLEHLDHHQSSHRIETIPITTGPNEMVPARLLRHEHPQHYILFFHGNGERARDLDGWLKRLSSAMNATVLACEYRGFEDDRTPTEAGILEDCLATHDYFQKEFNLSADNIVLYGRSLGGGCAAAVAGRRGAKALVLERTFDAMWKVAASHYPLIPVQVLMRNRFDSIAYLASYRGPLIQIHGAADSSIPIEHARELYRNVDTPDKVWLEVPGMEHNDSLSTQWLDRIAAEVDRLA